MGLSFTGYEMLEAGRDDGRAVRLCRVPSFAAYADDVPEGYYTCCGKSAGGDVVYSVHYEWRELLCRMVGISDMRSYWKSPHPGPFAEIINNADNDGYIGPVTSAKLAQDFDHWRERAEHCLPDWAFDLYEKWSIACHLAANGGAVVLH